MPKYTFEAVQFCDAIRDLASKPENLQNADGNLKKNHALQARWLSAGGFFFASMCSYMASMIRALWGLVCRLRDIIFSAG